MPKEGIRAACYVARRQTTGGTEVLLTQRAVWNYQRETMMRHPGIWVVPGGKIGHREKPLSAAQREFKEETGYQGRFHKSRYLVTSNRVDSSEDSVYVAHFFTGTLDPNPVLVPPEFGEVLRCEWLHPQAALDLVHSQEGLVEMIEGHLRDILDESQIAAISIGQPELPVGTIYALETILMMEDRGHFQAV